MTKTHLMSTWRTTVFTLIVVVFVSPASAIADSAEADGFDALLAEWKAKLIRIRELQVRYDSAVDDEKSVIESEYHRLVPETERMADRLVQAATAAYRAAPEQNAEISRFLVAILGERTAADRFEEVLALGQSMIDGNTPHTEVYVLTGVAAYSLDAFDLAHKYLTVAQDAGLLTKEAAGENPARLRIFSSAVLYLADVERARELWAQEQSIRASEAKADDLPRVKLETSKGPIVVELFENQAPNTVANFIYLVEELKFYDDSQFFIVLPGYLAQGGSRDGSGGDNPGYRIRCECVRKDHRKHFRGSLSMAHNKNRPDTGGAQFLLGIRRIDHLDGAYTVFGRVVEGIDVLSRLQRRDPRDLTVVSQPEPDRVLKASVLRKRSHEYKPKRLPHR